MFSKGRDKMKLISVNGKRISREERLKKKKTHASSKKIFAALLAFVMIFGIVPMSTGAGGLPITTENQIDEHGGSKYYNEDGLPSTTQVIGEGDCVVEVSKTIAAGTKENEFIITLDVKTTVDTDKGAPAPDSAVVIVIDASTSMTYSPMGHSIQMQTEYPAPLNSSGEEMAVYAANQTVYGSTYGADLGIGGSSRTIYQNGSNYYAYNSNNEWVRLATTSGGRYYFTNTALTIPASKTRIGLAKAAAVAFLDSFVNEAGDSKRMVSIVTFGNASNVAYEWHDLAGSANAANLTDAKNIINGISINSNTGTYTQGGLMHARNLYLPAYAPNTNGTTGSANGTAIDNRFVVLLTDGNPTHSNSSNDDQTLNQLPNNDTNGGSENIANVSRGSFRAAAVADQIKNGTYNGNYAAFLYTIGFGLTDDTFRRDGTESGTAGAMTGDDWLRDNIADKHYQAKDANQLNEAFDSIADMIKMMANAWVVTDPMADYIINDGVIPPAPGTYNNVANFSGGILTWSIRNSDPYPLSGTVVFEDQFTKIVVYSYQLQYKVKLDNLMLLNGDRYEAEDQIPTNDPTTLLYVMGNKKAEEYDEKDFHLVDFDIPEIHGYDTAKIAQFSFTKLDNKGNALKDAEFALYVDGGTAPFKTAISDEDGMVDFGVLPSGHIYTLVETNKLNGFQQDGGTHTLTVSFGSLFVASSNNALAEGTDGGYVFTNKSEEYSVTVEYYVLTRGGHYRLVNSMTESRADYRDGDDYTFYGINDGITAEVYERFRYQGRYYYFDSGYNEFTGDDIYDPDDYADLEGSIDGDDVVIKLYYSRFTLPNDIPLRKSIDKLSDATWPSGYTFSFALYIKDDDNNYIRVTDYLEYTAADWESDTTAGISDVFTFNLPSGLRADDLLNAKLYIRETYTPASQNWSSDAIDGYVPFGTLRHIIGFTAEKEGSTSITNTYSQMPEFQEIDLLKYFKLPAGVEEITLIPEFDGAVKDTSCGWVEHKHGDGDCDEPNCTDCNGTGLIDTECQTCEGAGEIAGELCEDCNGTGQIQEECPNCGGTGTLPCTIPEHTHDDSCYTYFYEFTFELVDEATGAVIAEKTVQIPYEDMLKLLNGDLPNWPVAFDDEDIRIAIMNILPAPGTAPEDYLYVTIREKSNNYGWAPASNYTGIIINPYGKVTYKQGDNVAEMTNVFNGITAPSFSFYKAVVDARSIPGRTPASYYSGDFTFNLYNDNTNELIDTQTITVVNGIMSGGFVLDQFINKTVRLRLEEVIPQVGDPVKVDGMTYDPTLFYINIANDVATVEGRHPILFVNTLLDPIKPEATIDKWVNTQTEEAVFEFGWSYEGYENTDLLHNTEVLPVNGSGTITVNGAADTYKQNVINLPLNFTGTLAIWEENGGLENWEYDDNVFTVKYFLGKPVGKNASGNATFFNNYYAPEVTFSKDVGSEDIILGEVINYRITIVNEGDEDLKNVVVKDAMFNDSVVVRLIGPSALTSPVLVKDADYTLEDGEIVFNDGFILKQGKIVRITYTVEPTLAVPLENIAYFEADRTITMGDPIKGQDEVIVEVTKQVSKLNVDKTVVTYTDGMDFESVTGWAKNVTFTSSGNRAAFKVAITNTGEGALTVGEIADSFDAQGDLSGATFYYNNGYGLEAYQGLDKLLEAISGIELYNGDGEIVFYFVSNAVTTTGVFKNIVNVVAFDSYQDRNPGSSEATVTATWGGSWTYTYTDPTPIPTPVVIEDPEPPLIDLPNKQPPPAVKPPIVEEDVEIEDPEVPLAGLPQTGHQQYLPVGVLGLGMAVLTTGLLMGRKKEEDLIG